MIKEMDCEIIRNEDDTLFIEIHKDIGINYLFCNKTKKLLKILTDEEVENARKPSKKEEKEKLELHSQIENEVPFRDD